jgi:hypothetical protein
MSEKRDKFLCEQLGEEYIERPFNKSVDTMVSDLREDLEKQDWDSWTGFGVLFEWAKGEDWFQEFLEACNGIVMYEKDERGGKDPMPFTFINMTVIDSPDDFANAIFEFLESREESKEKSDVPAGKVICPKALETCVGNCDHAEAHEKDDSCENHQDTNTTEYDCPFADLEIHCEPYTEEEEDLTIDKTQVMICMYSHLLRCNKNCPHSIPHYSCDDCAETFCNAVKMKCSCVKSYKQVKPALGPVNIEKGAMPEEVWST